MQEEPRLVVGVAFSFLNLLFSKGLLTHRTHAEGVLEDHGRAQHLSLYRNSPCLWEVF